MGATVSAYAISLIRTYVPLGVGVLVAWLSSLGVVVDDSARTALVSGIGAVAAGLYYALARLLEAHFPWAGLLLGKAVVPSYIDQTSKHVAPPAVPPQPQSPIDPDPWPPGGP